MKLEDQVCSEAQGKRLKELGIGFNCLFVHIHNSHIERDCGVKLKTETTAWKHKQKIFDAGVITHFPSFTVAELGIMLPDGYLTKRIKLVGGYVCSEHWPGTKERPNRIGTTQADCMAKMLIHLLENKLITPEEVNNRLNQ